MEDEEDERAWKRKMIHSSRVGVNLGSARSSMRSTLLSRSAAREASRGFDL